MRYLLLIICLALWPCAAGAEVSGIAPAAAPSGASVTVIGGPFATCAGRSAFFSRPAYQRGGGR